MKSFKATKAGMIFMLVFAAIFIIAGIISPFISQESEDDPIIGYILLAAFVAIGIFAGIGGIVIHLKEKRNYNALNEFIKQCGENAVAIPSIYFKTDNQAIYTALAGALKTGSGSEELGRMLKKRIFIYYALICDDGIYFIPFNDVGSREKYIFYKRESLPRHIVTVRSTKQILVDCPEIKMLFAVSAFNMPEITHNELLQRITELYANTLQENTVL